DSTSLCNGLRFTFGARCRCRTSATGREPRVTHHPSKLNAFLPIAALVPGGPGRRLLPGRAVADGPGLDTLGRAAPDHARGAFPGSLDAARPAPGGGPAPAGSGAMGRGHRFHGAAHAGLAPWPFPGGGFSPRPDYLLLHAVHAGVGGALDAASGRRRGLPPP